MMLTELTGVPEGALPLAEMREHLRLGTGFADDGVQDALVLAYLRSALAAIEGRIGKALIARRFRWTVGAWRDAGGQALPLAPVSAVVSVTLVRGDGAPVAVEPARWRLVADQHRPRLVPAGACLPAIPAGGVAEVVFDAGFGPAWGDVPDDLRQAVRLLAASYHETRHLGGFGAAAAMPFAVAGLIERWRTVRVLGGGAR
jgi:uncharacterized phiE125 gp8 family phage protein